MTRPAGKREKTLIVGTTTDYIDWIRNVAPRECLFLTDPDHREKAKEARPEADEEVLSNLADYPEAIKLVEEHLERWGIAPDGIACFDCESMELAALLAERFVLPYPSSRSVLLCRDKYLSKLAWREAGLTCPGTRKVRSPEDAAVFLAEAGGRAVIKPLTGSGSEHVYMCGSAAEIRTRYEAIHAALQDRRFHRLYRSSEPVGELIVAEEYISGEEYSCDFIIDGEQATLIRLTKKIRAQDRPFGTIHAYVLGAATPEGIGREYLLDTIANSARSLGINRGICMLDFMVRNREIVLLEMAPRPGGDCLPWLLLKTRGIDIIKLAVDFARQERGIPPLPPADAAAVFMGVRIIAREGGTIKAIDTGTLENDPRIMEIGIENGPGQRIVMPPDDYDSWILGYVIARVEPGRDPEEELSDLDSKIKVFMDAE